MASLETAVPKQGACPEALLFAVSPNIEISAKDLLSQT